MAICDSNKRQHSAFKLKLIFPFNLTKKSYHHNIIDNNPLNLCLVTNSLKLFNLGYTELRAFYFLLHNSHDFKSISLIRPNWLREIALLAGCGNSSISSINLFPHVDLGQIVLSMRFIKQKYRNIWLGDNFCKLESFSPFKLTRLIAFLFHNLPWWAEILRIILKACNWVSKFFPDGSRYFLEYCL